MTTRPQYQGSVKQSDVSNNPILVDTIPYSSFVASATLQKNYINKLSPNAKRRVFTLSSSLNVNTGAISILLVDNAGIQGGVSFANTNSPDTLTKSSGITSSNYDSWGSPANPMLGNPVDSFILDISIGATAPTSGNLYVMVREVF